MPFTTGYITNAAQAGTGAVNVVVNIVNENISNAANVEIRIFYSGSPDVKIPLFVTVVTLPINTVRRRTFFIQGVFAYEIQYNISSATPEDVVISSYGLDQFGNIVQEQRVLNEELTFIPALSSTGP